MTVTSMPESNLNLSGHLTLTSSLQGFLACVSNLFLQKPLLYPSLLLFILPCLFGLPAMIAATFSWTERRTFTKWPCLLSFTHLPFFPYIFGILEFGLWARGQGTACFLSPHSLYQLLMVLVKLQFEAFPPAFEPTCFTVNCLWLN